MIVLKSLLLGLSQLGLRTRHVISTCTVLVKLPKRVSKMRVLGQFNLVQLPLQMVLPWGHQGCVSHWHLVILLLTQSKLLWVVTMSMPLLLLVAVIRTCQVQWLLLPTWIFQLFLLTVVRLHRVILTVRISTWFLFSKVSVNGTTEIWLPKRLKILNVMPALALVVVVVCILLTQWQQQLRLWGWAFQDHHLTLQNQLRRRLISKKQVVQL